MIFSILLNLLLIITIVIVINKKDEKTESVIAEISLPNNEVVTPIENIPTAIVAPTQKPTTLSEKLEKSTKYYYSDLMNNPIDQAYSPLITDYHISEIEFRQLQIEYEEIWEQEYNKALQIIKNKAVYQEDKDSIDQFDIYVRNIFTDNKTFFETTVLNDYSDPSLPEKNSYGNGTNDRLIEIQGKIYRNACMQIITLLPYGEYQYPENIDFKTSD